MSEWIQSASKHSNRDAAEIILNFHRMCSKNLQRYLMCFLAIFGKILNWFRHFIVNFFGVLFGAMFLAFLHYDDDNDLRPTYCPFGRWWRTVAGYIITLGRIINPTSCCAKQYKFYTCAFLTNCGVSHFLGGLSNIYCAKQCKFHPDILQSF